MQGVRRGNKWIQHGGIVDFLRIAILMAHPVLAMMLIWAFMRQRSWRHQKIDIEQKEMVNAIRNHERNGNRIMAYIFCWL